MAEPKDLPEPTPITYENMDTFEQRPVYPDKDSMGNRTGDPRFFDKRREQETIEEMAPPVRNNPHVEDDESGAAAGIRLARSVLRDAGASRNAKKVARMLIAILETPVPQSISRTSRTRTKQ